MKVLELKGNKTFYPKIKAVLSSIRLSYFQENMDAPIYVENTGINVMNNLLQSCDVPCNIKKKDIEIRYDVENGLRIYDHEEIFRAMANYPIGIRQEEEEREH